jgi:rare lipoprotein A
MQPGRNRHARKDDHGWAPTSTGCSLRRLRWAACATLLVAAIAAPSALAAMGGASNVTAYGGASTEREDIAFSPMRSAAASWYGPGFYGNRTACGVVLRPATIGVAHRTLPCGTTVKFAFHGRTLVTTVIDRGPFAKGRAWDLTNGAREVLGFEGAGALRYAVGLELARP